MAMTVCIHTTEVVSGKTFQGRGKTSPVVRRFKDCLFLAEKRSKRKTFDRKKTVAPYNYN